MLLIDKYKITDKNNIHFHQDIYNKLLNIIPLNEMTKKECDYLTSNINNMSLRQKYDMYTKILRVEKCSKFKKISNILVHGISGSGKKSLINMFLQEIYGPSINDLETQTYKIVGYGNSEVEVDILQSKHHIIIEPNNTGIDKYIIQEVVKNYVKVSGFCFDSETIPFRVVLINNVDNLSYYAQTSLRYTMERYHKTCKFILCGYQISKILEPLRSRCMCIRVPRPSDIDLFKFLYHVIENEKISIKPSTVNNIIKKSDNNIKTCLWWLEYYNNKLYDFTFSWKTYLSSIIELLHLIHKQKKVINVVTIITIRKTLNNILITNINGSEIMVELMNQIVMGHPEYSQEFMTKILHMFQMYESQLSKGTRIIIHLEALIMNLCKVFYEQPFEQK